VFAKLHTDRKIQGSEGVRGTLARPADGYGCFESRKKVLEGRREIVHDLVQGKA